MNARSMGRGIVESIAGTGVGAVLGNSGRLPALLKKGLPRASKRLKAVSRLDRMHASQRDRGLAAPHFMGGRVGTSIGSSVGMAHGVLASNKNYLNEVHDRASKDQ